MLAEPPGHAAPHAPSSPPGAATPRSRSSSHLCDEIAAGRIGVALLAGGEAFQTMRALGKAGVPSPWTPPSAVAVPRWGDTRPGVTETESRHGAREAYVSFALFENAFRAARGQSLAAQRAELGAFGERCARIAAGNPHAWFRDAKDAATLDDGDADEPHGRVPLPQVPERHHGGEPGRGAAARERGGGAPSRRARGSLGVAVGGRRRRRAVVPLRSRELPRAARACAAAAADAAGARRPRRVERPASRPVRLLPDRAAAVRRHARDRPRHRATAHRDRCAAVVRRSGQRLRDARGRRGRGTHPCRSGCDGVRACAGLELHEARARRVRRHAGRRAAGSAPAARRCGSCVESQAHPAVADAPAGRGTLETYTVVHGRDGAPERGVAIGLLDDGRRFVAVLPRDRAVLEAFERDEQVGRVGTVRTADGISTFDPA